jgi:hypothetical protein
MLKCRCKEGSRKVFFLLSKIGRFVGSLVKWLGFLGRGRGVLQRKRNLLRGLVTRIVDCNTFPITSCSASHFIS